MKVNEDAYERALAKVRKLRLLDHVPIMDKAPPAVTFKAVMERGLGGAYEDAAIDYVMRRFLKYYLGDASSAVSSKDHPCS